ncbi:MAG: hypothetical protein ACFFCO_12195 [Promethearchaeota archaeon]
MTLLVIVVFEDTGILKSELKPFEFALRQLDVHAEHVIHVGDRIKEDVACRQLGIYFIWSTFHLPFPGHHEYLAAFKHAYDNTANTYPWLLAIIEGIL